MYGGSKKRKPNVGNDEKNNSESRQRDNHTAIQDISTASSRILCSSMESIHKKRHRASRKSAKASNQDGQWMPQVKLRKKTSILWTDNLRNEKREGRFDRSIQNNDWESGCAIRSILYPGTLRQYQRPQMQIVQAKGRTKKEKFLVGVTVETVN